MEQLTDALSEVELDAERVLNAKRQVTECDLARNKNREALAALRRQESAGAAAGGGAGSFGNHTQGFVVRPGGVFVRMPTHRAAAVLVADQERLELEITEQRQRVKTFTKALNDKGGLPTTYGKGLVNAMVTLSDLK